MSSRSNILFVGSLAVLSIFLTSRADAQQICPGQPGASVGPDVIVGVITGPSNYTANGNIEALSLGTTSCNIGSTNLLWIANDNRHPVIGGTLYRYTQVDGAGRFEQVGQSWLKHGFTALTQNTCCSCSGQGGQVLGVGCADPYTSGRNGTQPGLGPKYQVNAHTGVFTYPPAGGTGGSGSTYRRLEVDIGDLAPSAAVSPRYFSESHYVTQDDATANNQNNNVSYIATTVSGSGSAWTFGFSGSTVRMKSAIEAWPLVEAGATVVPVQVSGDGLFMLGQKVTAIAGGMYRYEFAVYNMNSDRNGGEFTVPVNNTVNVTNIGFHDVTYRNGDGNGNVNFSGADWTGVRNGTDVTWACQTQAQNTNANAIRWGTTYNFRFDADAAPVAGAITLGLWKPGTPASVNVNAQVPGNGGPASFAYCFGDGTGTACPCGNNSFPGNDEGCLNSLGGGGLLTISGTSSISADTLSLNGNGMPDSSALYFQGTGQVNGGNGAGFGDGLRCAGGTVVRLGIKTNNLGQSQYPSGPDVPVSIKGNVLVAGLRNYQVWYRNADPTFCTGDTFNLTNGYQVVWQP